MGGICMHMRIEGMVGVLTLLFAITMLIVPTGGQLPTGAVSDTFAIAVGVGGLQIAVANKPEWIGTTLHFISAVLGAALWSSVAVGALFDGAPGVVVAIYFVVMAMTLWDVSNA